MQDDGFFGFVIGFVFCLLVSVAFSIGFASNIKEKYEKTLQQNRQNIRNVRESVMLLLVEKEVDAKIIIEVVEKFEKFDNVPVEK